MSTLLEDAPLTTKKFTFRLMFGNYTEGRGADQKTYQVYKDPVTKLPVHQLIETDKDLHALFDQEGFPAKFQPVEGIPEPVYVNPTERQPGESIQAYMSRLNELQATIKAQLEERLKEVDKMSKEQLETFAENEEIDLKNAKTVEQMRVAVKTALKG